MATIFQDWTWLVQCAITVTMIGGAGMLVRSLRAPGWLHPVAMIGALLLALTWLFPSGDEFLAVLPSPATIGHFGALLAQSAQDVHAYGVPVPDGDALLFITALGIGSVAVVVDVLTVTLRRPALAGLPMLALVALRSDPAYGLAAIIFLLIVVWTTDIGAYFAGRAMGGPKLAPRISPKKTWSGAIGGLVAAVVASALFVWFLLPADLLPDTLLPLILLAAVLSAVSQCGDLLESALKRRFDVKDSSRLIPGHGGLMDRVDALIVAAVAGGLVGVARGGADAAGAGLLLW